MESGESRRRLRRLLRSIWELVCGPWRWIKANPEFVTAVIALVAFLQWRTLENTDQTLRLAQRPWIGTDKIEALKWPTREGEEVVFGLRYFLKNVGHSPAVVFVHARVFVVLEASKLEFQKLQSEVCKTARKEVDKRDGSGWGLKYAVLPNDTFPYDREDEKLTDENLNVAKVGRIGKEYRAVIVGCVLYMSPLDKETHKTPFYGWMSVDDSKDQLKREIINPIRISDLKAPKNRQLIVKAISIAGDAD